MIEVPFLDSGWIAGYWSDLFVDEVGNEIEGLPDRISATSWRWEQTEVHWQQSKMKKQQMRTGTEEKKTWSFEEEVKALKEENVTGDATTSRAFLFRCPWAAA